MTLQEHWREYRDMIYPKALPALQNRETHQAFFAGALVCLGELQLLAGLPDAEALKVITALCSEAEQVCAGHGMAIKARN